MRTLEAIHARQALLARLGSGMPFTGSDYQAGVSYRAAELGAYTAAGQVIPFAHHASTSTGAVFVSDLGPSWATLRVAMPGFLFEAAQASGHWSSTTATVRTRTAPARRTARAAAVTFLEVERVRNEEVRAIIAILDKIFDIQVSVQLKDRLEELRAIWEDENGGDSSLSVSSLIGLIGFLQQHGELRMPSIVSTPSGTFVAEWRKDPDHLFSVHFTSDTEARFVVFSADVRRQKIIKRGYGQTTIESLFSVARAWSADRWMLG